MQSFRTAACGAIFGTALLALGAGGCSNDNEGSCERIVEACHDKDTGSGAAHDCHELAEGGADDSACAAKEDDCMSACEGG